MDTDIRIIRNGEVISFNPIRLKDIPYITDTQHSEGVWLHTDGYLVLMKNTPWVLSEYGWKYDEEIAPFIANYSLFEVNQIGHTVTVAYGETPFKAYENYLQSKESNS